MLSSRCGLRLLWWLPLWSVQCGPVRHLGYDTSAIAAEPGPRLNATVTVELFEDKRRDHDPAIVFTAKENPLIIDGNVVCINLAREYAGKIPNDLRNVVERHLRQRHVISAWNAENEEYVLEGSLFNLYAHQVLPEWKVNFVPVGPGMAGITGMAAIAGAAAIDVLNERRPARIYILFSELRLTRVRDGASKQLPDVSISSNAIPNSSSDCNAVFAHVDNKLKEAVELLAISVEQAVRTWSDSE